MTGDEIILEALSARPTESVSGEELAAMLGVSRTAVWKRIKGLREMGYRIEGSTSRGYTLAGIEDLIRPDVLRRKLQTRFVGRNMVYKPLTESTNSDAFSLGLDGAENGTVVLADVQTKGRGRLGRSWSAPAGSAVLTSVILRPAVSPHEATLLTLAAGIAAARTVMRVTDLKPWIKWPNDVFVGKRKLAGILTEMHAEIDKLHFVVVGMGMNVNIARSDFPDEIQNIATSLSIETGRTVNRNQVLATLYLELEHAYTRFIEQGRKAIIGEWEEIAEVKGRRVAVSLIDGSRLLGTAHGLDRDGSLVVEDSHGHVHHVTAGDVEVKGLHRRLPSIPGRRRRSDDTGRST